MDPEGRCSDNDIYRALDMAQLTEVVQQQAAGLDTEVTEGGENFSVGQRQVIHQALFLLPIYWFPPIYTASVSEIALCTTKISSTFLNDLH